MYASKHSTTEFYIQPSLIFLFFKKDFVYPKAALNSKFLIASPITSAGIISNWVFVFLVSRLSFCAALAVPDLCRLGWLRTQLSACLFLCGSWVLGLKVWITTTQPKVVFNLLFSETGPGTYYVDQAGRVLRLKEWSPPSWPMVIS